MVATFSPHRDAGGTLHLPSPTGMHHVDASSAIRQLRRSLSRSPSKSSDCRLLPSRHNAPFTPSPLSPSRRSQQSSVYFLPAAASQFFSTTPSSPSPTSIASSHASSSKIHRPVVRRAGSFQSARGRTSPKSPSKRALHISSDHGNATRLQPAATPANDTSKLPDTAENNLFEEHAAESPTEPSNSSKLAPRYTLSRVEKRRNESFGSLSSALSPLKRSDGIMDLDGAELDSPSAKRRSVHSPSFELDMNVFDSPDAHQTPSSTEPSDDMTREMHAQDASSPQTPAGSPYATIPRRSSSLRRSTLQHRQSDRSIFGRSRLGSESELSPAVMRHRLSLDSNLFGSPSRENPFAPASPFGPGTSIFSGSTLNAPKATNAAHPLSRTITQSSSSSSLADDSPTHDRVHRPQVPSGFSKSLPIGAKPPILREDSGQSTDSFSTPENYKLVKPVPAAFMSTGLISKKNRNIEDVKRSSLRGKNMPDTPCKRPAAFLPSAQKALPVRPVDRSQSGRPSFGAPSTPFAPHQTTPGPFAQGRGLFDRPEISRRDSFVSLDGDDQSLTQSPSACRGGYFTPDVDFPPTPTKRPANGTLSDGIHALLAEDSTDGPTVELGGFASPRTPKDNILPPDPSGLSISGRHEQFAVNDEFDSSTATFPETPTGPRESVTGGGRKSLLLAGYGGVDVDSSLTSRFGRVELIGTGEFSQVYRVSDPADDNIATPNNSSFSASTSSQGTSSSRSRSRERVWAVKRTKYPLSGMKDRERRLNEVDVLRTLSNSDHIISFVDCWEENGHLYIQTEFCEEGSLDVFLAEVGLKARLDDFRIWKILLELSLGLKHIHDSGFIHLDLKPANILITFEGVLKIADFGMATPWPAKEGIEGEGDREYIGPEVLMGRYDKPADIFALGLILFEIAANVQLPENGASWQKLRNGDISDVPSLTWSSEMTVIRDAAGNPVSDPDELYNGDLDMEHDPSGEGKSRYQPRKGELLVPPTFMVDANHEQALERIVRWMISPNPDDRPTISQVIQTDGVQWAMKRRRAGATVFEGTWGPADEVLNGENKVMCEDTEMIDV